MDIKKFSFNKSAMFGVGQVGHSKQSLKDILTKPRIYIKKQNYFQTRYPNVFEKYKLPDVNQVEIMTNWNASPMQFWQNQLNFAVWCATSGCCVSYRDHIMASGCLGSLYRFHVYYTIRRILAEMQTPNPQDISWDPFNNPYNQRAYERICSEFQVSVKADWRISGSTDGLGKAYF